jgi:hypothetical protein
MDLVAFISEYGFPGDAGSSRPFPSYSSPSFVREDGGGSVRRRVKGANLRGTLDLKISCLDIILLCGWTAVHPNVPAPLESKIKEIGKKTLWMIMDAISPEFVLVRALEQFTAARDPKNVVSKIGKIAAAEHNW